MPVSDPIKRAERAHAEDRGQRPLGSNEELVTDVRQVANLIGWLVRAAISVPILLAGAVAMDVAYQKTKGLDQRLAALATYDGRGPGVVEDSWWQLDLDPDLVGSSTTGWPGMARADLCTGFSFEPALVEGAVSNVETASGANCRPIRLSGRWMLLEHTTLSHWGPPLPWIDGEGESLMSLRLTPRAKAWFTEHTPWDWPWLPQTDEARAMPEAAEGNILDAIWITVDRPLDHMLRDWLRPEQRRVTVAYDSANLKKAMLEDNWRDASSPPPELRPLAYGMGFVGVVLCCMGWGFFLPRPVPRLVAVFLGLATAATIFLWGGRLQPAIARVSPQVAELVRVVSDNVLPDATFSSPKLVMGETVLEYSLARSNYHDVLSQFALVRPEGVGSADEMLDHLSAEVHRQLEAMPVQQAAAVFERLRQYQILGRAEISILFFEAANEFSLAPQYEGSAAARAAHRFLSNASLNHYGLHRDRLAYASRKRIWEQLLRHPRPVISNSARSILEQSE